MRKTKTGKVVTIPYWTQRQQSPTAEEMVATGVCFNNIGEWEKNTDYDFHINTGVI